jgi:Tfp pilus assembly protein FimV
MRPRGRSAVRALQGLKEDNCVPRSATSGPEADPAAERDAVAGRAWRRPRRPARPGRHPAHPQPANLLADQVQSPDRFYAISSRDFTAVFAR